MKKLFALLLALCLLLAAVPGLALEESEVFGAFDEEGRGHWGPPYDHSQWKKMVGFELKQDANITAKVYDEQGKLFNTLMTGESCDAGYVVINWPAVDENGWHAGKGETVTYSLEVTAEVNGEMVTTHVPYSIIYAHSYTDHLNYQVKWYAYNTLCAAGIEFRDVKPEVTGKWYNFVPIDLSRDGEQVFDLVASNKYVVGSVKVAVEGDQVTVTWARSRQDCGDANLVVEDEFLTFFPDLAAVETVEPDEYEGPEYEFGQAISIANDLGGDTNVLLYIRNLATYCNNMSYKYQKPIYHTEYDENAAKYVALREAMTELMNADQAE